MSSYNSVERTVANLLDRSPRTKRTIKTLYQHVNYYAFADRDFECALHPDATLVHPSDWFSISRRQSPTFFGYFDKSPWSPQMNKAVFHEVADDDHVNIVVYDEGGVTSVGRTPLWNYQQGAMAQWHPARSDQVVFNDLVEGDWGTRIVTADGEDLSVVQFPIQVIHPTRNEGLSLNYKRLDRIRPEYGYSEPTNRFSSRQPYDEDGVWKVDLSDGSSSLLISIETLRTHEPRSEMRDADHKVNHILYSPSGDRFVFMHRWIGSEGKFSRLYIADSETGDFRLLLDDRIVSHYCWLDETNLLVWGRSEHGDCYVVVDVTSGAIEKFGSTDLDVYGDGHPSLSPDGDWVALDTYPDRERKRHLLLAHTKRNDLVEVGQFFAPLSYEGDNRCDLHPRWSPDGTMLSIDSAHTGERGTYFIRVDEVL